MQRVDKNVGTATSLAPTTMDWRKGSFMATCRSMFSMTTVPLSTKNTDSQRKTAERHGVQRLTGQINEIARR